MKNVFFCFIMATLWLASCNNHSDNLLVSNTEIIEQLTLLTKAKQNILVADKSNFAKAEAELLGFFTNSEGFTDRSNQISNAKYTLESTGESRCSQTTFEKVSINEKSVLRIGDRIYFMYSYKNKEFNRDIDSESKEPIVSEGGNPGWAELIVLPDGKLKFVHDEESHHYESCMPKWYKGIYSL